jgi:hypothetical protein
MEDDHSDLLFTFVEKLIFEIVVMTSENKYLPNLTFILINMLNKNDN